MIDGGDVFVLIVLRVLFGWWLPLAAAAGPLLAAGPEHRIRSADPRIASLVDEGRRRSATFGELSDAIARTDGIVYVVPGRCPVGGMRGCLLHVINAGDHARYLWIVVAAVDETAEQIALIAHELQHAVELLQNPSIRTSHDILTFYRSIHALNSLGVRPRSGGRAWETAAAIAAAQAVRLDLAAPAPAIDADVR